jgi:hypothetical protein
MFVRTTREKKKCGAHTGSVLTVNLYVFGTEGNKDGSSKQVRLGGASPLEDAGILLHMLNILGPGHLFIAAVSRAWKERWLLVCRQLVELLILCKIPSCSHFTHRRP